MISKILGIIQLKSNWTKLVHDKVSNGRSRILLKERKNPDDIKNPVKLISRKINR
jgi:hypothetical protein